MKRKFKSIWKKFKSIYYPTRVIIIITVAVFVFAVVMGVASGDNYQSQEVAGVSTCDNQKQLNQLSSLYDAQADTKIIQVKMSGFVTYLEKINEFPNTSHADISENQKIIDGLPGFLDGTDKEISDIAKLIIEVKLCNLLDDKTAEEYKNFNKYDYEASASTGI